MKNLYEKFKKRLKKKEDNKIFLKITNKQEYHDGYQYKDGLNVLDKKMDKMKRYDNQEIFFTDPNNICGFLRYGENLRIVKLPTNDKNLKTIKNVDRWHTNGLILLKKYDLFDIETWKMLENIGINVNASNYYIMEWATSNGCLELVKYIFESTKSDTYIDEAMRFAAKKGHINIVEYLKNKTDITFMDNIILIEAVEKNHIKMVEYLIQNGCNIMARENSAIEIAVKNGNLDMLKLIIKYGGSVKNAFNVASINGRFEIIQYLVNNNIIDITNPSFDIVLAAAWGHLDIVKYLLKNGANISSQNNKAIKMAKMNNRTDVVDFLLKHK